ncbi:MAG: winged helix DNA-binding domain-containing protein [Actinomycetota bacterium]|nr:winged helix DNA-binding domain-containing protein [Actinomycetota bacterium]
MADELLPDRALNRALLARQLLLERRAMSSAEAIEHLVGLQAQAPNAPYVGLWTRLAPYDPEELAGLLERRAAIRTHVMRTTVHLVTTRDGATLRPLMQPVLDRSFASSPWAKRLHGVDLDAVAAAGRDLLGTGVLTRAQLAARLAERFPGHDPLSLAHTVTIKVPVVQVPPRGIWGARGRAAWAVTEAWTGTPLDTKPSVDAVVLRYLAAFGPARIPDVRTWSGLTQQRDVMERLRPRLLTFRDARGRELFDLPDAPRPAADAPAPPRFLPEYDNVLLSHEDRARINADGRRVPLPPGNGGARGTLLVDGFFRGLWRLEREGPVATVRVESFDRFTRAERAAVVAEGERLAAFTAPDAVRHGAAIE